MILTNKFLRYWLPVLVWCGVIFVQSAFPSPDSLPRFPYSDKLMHICMYGLLAFLMCRAVNALDRYHQQYHLVFFLSVTAATLYGLSDEWHQSFVVARTAEIADIAADFIGSLVGATAHWLVMQRWRVD